MSIHEDWKDPQAPKPGMSRGVKILLIVGCVGGFFLLLCCGGVGVFLWKAKDVLENVAVALQQLAVTTEADEIRSRTRSIVEIDIPPEFEPKIGVEMVVMRWVGYENKSEEGARLMLFGLDESMVQSRTLPEMRRELERMFEQQSAQKQTGDFDMHISVTERETRSLTVLGESVEFDFNKGTGRDDKPMRQVVGVFKKSGGVILLNLVAAESAFNEEAIVRMIESIREPVEEVEAEDDSEKMTEEAAESKADESPAEKTPADQTPSGTDAPEEANKEKSE